MKDIHDNDTYITRARELEGAHLGTMSKDLRTFFKNFPSLKLISPWAGLFLIIKCRNLIEDHLRTIPVKYKRN